MKSYKRRIFSLLLCLTMVLTLLPIMQTEANATSVSADAVQSFVNAAKSVTGKNLAYFRNNYGMPSGNWCGYFVAWCMNNSQISNTLGTISYSDAGGASWPAIWAAQKDAGTIYVLATGSQVKNHKDTYYTHLVNGQRYDGTYLAGKAVSANNVKKVDSFTPQAGDIVLFNWDNDGAFDHVGIMTSANTYIDGNGGSSIDSSVVTDGRALPTNYVVGYFRFGAPSVTFGPWERTGKTYIKETDASIGQTITIPGGNPSDSGMYLYDQSGNHLATGSNGRLPSWYGYVYFKINEECRYTLTPGTTYKYRFYVVLDGKTYWSDFGSFTTKGSNVVIAAKPANTESKSAEKLRVNVTVSGTSITIAWTDVGADRYALNIDNTDTLKSVFTANVGGDLSRSLTLDAGNYRAYVTGLYTNAVDQVEYADFVVADDLKAHTLIHVATKAATCTEAGNIEYWYCSDCGKYFADAEAKSEITREQITVPALGHNYVNGKCTRDGAIDPTYNKSAEVHLPMSASYSQGQFSDVATGQWFTSGVASAVRFGLMGGNSANTFNPYGDVTLAEAITMAARINSIYNNTGSVNFDQSVGNAWYQTYLDYALGSGIISSNYYNADVTQKATRAQFAEIFAKSLPEEALAAIGSVADNAIPDVSMGASYAPYVYQLYRAGILTGGDALGTFSPQTYITRAEAATIVSRMADSDNRAVITLQ